MPSPDCLLVEADTAAKIANFGNETGLQNRRLVGARPWKHVADLGDLTFRLLRRGVEFRAKQIAGRIFISPHIRPQQLLRVVVGERNRLAVTDVEAKWIEVAIEKS